jgi:hypothetical protein
MEFLMVDDHKFPSRAFYFSRFWAAALLRWLGMLNRCHLSGGNLTQESEKLDTLSIWRCSALLR